MEERQEWFKGKRWGLFTHYLANPAGNDIDKIVTSQEWNERINNFNVELFVKQLKQTGADYFCITIGQNSGHFCSPNSTYDQVTGISPSKCSERDLVLELAEEASKYGIDMWVYLPTGAPCAEPQAVERLEWEWGYTGGIGVYSAPTTGKRLVEFQRKWEGIIREWSLRWGDKIKGWWMDGCYFPEDMYLFEDEPNFKSLSRSIRAGNPHAVIAYNKGLEYPFILQCEYDDFTAGEVGENLPLDISNDNSKEEISKVLGGRKLHVLSYLGKTWGQGEPRFPDQLAIGYSKYIIEKGGIITWDIPLNLDGSISECYQKQLEKINDEV